MSTYETGFAPQTAEFTDGDVMSLRLAVDTPGPDGVQVLRPAVVASVGDCWGEPTYELVPAAMADDLPAHETDIAAIVQGEDGSQTPVLRFVTTLGLKVCASAPVLSDTRRRTDRLPRQAHAALVADTARRAASRAVQLAARRGPARPARQKACR
ncbi:hypothetical protein ACVDG3_18710 [Meridianimarinicoccus sp. RP-17]|uniref:hypothetical protein n=1 Tax=Meridianimarinicoccus zhengii TaxID=2056810 RepID=UPI000DAF387B|nr:hypothetical protein [Phycocomes zhengii]